MSQFKFAIFIMFALLPACGQPDAPGEFEPFSPALRGSDNAANDARVASDIKTRVPGSWIVAFRTQASLEAVQFANFRSEVRFHQTALNSAFRSDPRVKAVDFITAADLSPEAIGEELPGLQQLQGFQTMLPRDPRQSPEIRHRALPSAVAAIAKVDFNSDADALETLAEWDSEGRFWFADPNGISQLSDTAKADDQFATWSTNYTALESSFYHLKSIEVAKAFNRISTRDATAVPTNVDILANPPLIAVIDSGVDYLHPQLKNRIFQNSSPGASGCSNDIYGCNVTTMGGGNLGDGNVYPNYVTAAGQACPADPQLNGKCNHGTHVAGIIAAEYQSNGSTITGPAGICPFCKIVVIKATGAEGGISDSSQLAGLKYVSLFRNSDANAIRVVNASFGQFQRNRAIAVIVAALRRTGNGIIVIAASGNEDTMLRSYPAALTDVIAVSAVGTDNNKAKFSNFGNWVDVAAPGIEIVSTIPGGSSAVKSGTSMASPVVSGIAGLLVAYVPGLSAKAIRERIISTASPGIYSSQTNQLNYQYYYAKIAGETVPRPLLGSGLALADGVLGGTSQGAYTSDAIQRVSPGCGLIARARVQGGSLGISEGKGGNTGDFDLGFVMMFVVSLFVLLARHREKSRWV